MKKADTPWYSDFRVRTINVEPQSFNHYVSKKAKKAEEMESLLNKLGFITHRNYTSIDVYGEKLSDEQVSAIKEIANLF